MSLIKMFFAESLLKFQTNSIDKENERNISWCNHQQLMLPVSLEGGEKIMLVIIAKCNWWWKL